MYTSEGTWDRYYLFGFDKMLYLDYPDRLFEGFIGEDSQRQLLKSPPLSSNYNILGVLDADQSFEHRILRLLTLNLIDKQT